MATPYFQLRLDSAPSTQDVARDRLDDLPILVLAARQTHGRGRTGAVWRSADRAVAASLAFHHAAKDSRPYSLIAGIAAVRAVPETTLKWPNDVMSLGRKVGGILVERTGDVTVIGLGLNLWWPEPVEGAAAIFESDPGRAVTYEIGALWGAELMEMVEEPGWPVQVYKEMCVTVGAEVTWDPGGSGKAVDVAPDGGLVVETDSGRETIYSGAVRHVR